MPYSTLNNTVIFPLKERYRNLFASNNENKTTGMNGVCQYAFNNTVGNMDHVPLTDMDAQVLLKYSSAPSNFYCTSVIKRSITEQISIPELEKIVSKRKSNGIINTVVDENQPPNNQSDSDIRKNKFVMTLPAKFKGKLKVNWLEKYESSSTSDTESDKSEPIPEVNEKVNEEAETTKSTRTLPRKRSRVKKEDEMETQRKSLRIRKGLIYQKFMATTLLSNRKEKNIIKNNDTSNQQKKRGRPKNNSDKSNESCDSSETPVVTPPPCIEEPQKMDLSEDVIAAIENKKLPIRKRLLPSMKCDKCDLDMIPTAKRTRKSTKRSSPESSCRCLEVKSEETKTDSLKIKRRKIK